MSTVSHQTARLARGPHRSPEGGTCVMELASMLAGEPFSDRPESVCPVVAGFLRHYNDGVAPDDRDDLYRFASEAVGSRAGADVTLARARLCRAWAFQRRTRRGRPGAHASALALVDRMLEISQGRALTMPQLGDRHAQEAVVAWEAPAR